MAGADIGTMHAAVALASSLFERLDDCPFFIKDAGLRYVAANPAMARLCGVRDAAALLGARASAFFPPLVAARYEALDAQVLASGEPLTDRLDLAAAGRGSAAWLLFSRHPLRGEDGSIIGVAASARRLAASEARQPMYARLARAVAQLEARPSGALDLEGLAALVGVSPSQLERDFRSAFGMSPMRFLHKLRIDRALPLIRDGQPIAEVAQAVGYTDQSAFTRRFGLVMGCTPTEWRRDRGQHG
ncbi:AraC-like DNA-binding protein [Polymorphobacter multimanifer]|uniref:AraC-like DNA-binding protein n=1 Tax=Polymorphobacter multimanifer TaxID=1070431 RepID=A0A841L4X2_9SPHN|nr:AraC family transcriptional regulator [Polymorphobacter multimanifer]MBB6227919.1 AraC-like DNA-binding protein [Polymorphobacter multimanifer]